MKYGIVIFPSKTLQDKANSLRKRYDSHYGLIPPHVTLKYPFEADEHTTEAIVQELRHIASEVQPFTLTSGNVSSFYPTNNVIYFKIAQSEALATLNNKMHDGVLATEKEYAFVPHLTIGQNLSDAEHADVLGRLKMLDYHYEQVIDRFHLLYQLEDGFWTVYETFHLGKDC
ncbi:YjcG family protein [Priestia taiwanensis]|uniref:Putative phosphoesterase GCM10007140_21760 n=1 Tax=Priestia taiwanensis TaxID=1347902 RepID=A0A917ERV3_9BACI|nr:YjcG family protein [Priestia taiwanensis]MBM7364083.1 2'-5' RNA ligase [Priestia taiwanensis]GGE71470.1 putative phosphoesterase [Priestia taiwanensis]